MRLYMGSLSPGAPIPRPSNADYDCSKVKWLRYLTQILSTFAKADPCEALYGPLAPAWELPHFSTSLKVTINYVPSL